MLDHGGNLQDAVLRYRRPREEWIDLSTGISPQSYPVPSLPAEIWHRLPEPSRALIDAAKAYYKAPHILPVAGSQAAIQALPRLRARSRPCSRVVVAAPAYSEHAHHWSQEGHALRQLAHAGLANAVSECDIMVVCNPNNPTGATVAPELLLEWAQQLAARGGWLIVDEAFADPTPELSIAAWSDRPGLIVLRSVGKFFGLAGLRLGFVASSRALLREFAEIIGPWTVSGAAQRIGCAALQDSLWQKGMREQLQQSGRRLHALLAQQGIGASGTALYQWWACREPQAFSRHMAERGIWVRMFRETPSGIRLGLPPDEAGWHRLEQALKEWRLMEKQE